VHRDGAQVESRVPAVQGACFENGQRTQHAAFSDHMREWMRNRFEFWLEHATCRRTGRAR